MSSFYEFSGIREGGGRARKGRDIIEKSIKLGYEFVSELGGHRAGAYLRPRVRSPVFVLERADRFYTHLVESH